MTTIFSSLSYKNPPIMSTVQDLLTNAKKKKKGKEIPDQTEISDDEKAKIESLIESTPVIVFSKSYCPYCRQAKMNFDTIINYDKKLNQEDYKVIEMDDGNHDGWQTYISEIASTRAIPNAANNNAKSVPQIFVHKKYIGGADDVADMYNDGSLLTMLVESAKGGEN